jgi:hypothetical protein
VLVEAPGIVSVEIDSPFESTEVLVTGSAYFAGVANERARTCTACQPDYVLVLSEAAGTMV